MNAPSSRRPRRGRRSTPVLAGAIFLLGGAAASADPHGGVVVGGSARIQQQPGRTTITQTSPRAILNWQGFDIGAGESAQFIQPSRSAIALNRVTGGGRSEILGELRANGNVWIINPNGVLIGPGARVDVGGLVATTTNIADANFLAGRFAFDLPSANTTARVVNEGTITVADFGLGALVAPGVRNQGVIAGRLGQIVLAGAPTFVLDLQGDNLLRFRLPADVREIDGAFVDNTGLIQAEGGQVLLTARAAAGVVDRVINVDGVIQADTVAARPGEIVLDGGARGTVSLADRITASGAAPGQRGGAVAIAGERVTLADRSSINVEGRGGGGRAVVGAARDGTPAARAVEMQGTARIGADATEAGDGGAVAIVATDRAQLLGSVSARGAGNGNGGVATLTSGGSLAFAGTADVGSAMGGIGTLAFDYRDVIIGQTGGAPGVSLLDPATIAAQLGRANVMVTATGDGGGANGAVTVTSPVFAPETANTLTLTAGGDIVLRAALDLSASRGGLALRADGVLADGQGALRVDDGGVIQAGVGAVRLAAGSGIGAPGRPLVVRGGAGQPLTLGAETTTGGIHLATVGEGPVTVETLRAGGGDIRLRREATVSGGGLWLGGGGVTAEKGAVVLDNASGDLAVVAPVTASGDVILTTAGALRVAGAPEAPAMASGTGGVSVAARDFDLAAPIAAARGSIRLASDRPLVFGPAGIDAATIDPANELPQLRAPALVVAGNGVAFARTTDFRAIPEVTVHSATSTGRPGDITAAGNAVIQADGLTLRIANPAGETLGGAVRLAGGAPHQVARLTIAPSTGEGAVGRIPRAEFANAFDLALVAPAAGGAAIAADAVALFVGGRLTLAAPIVAGFVATTGAVGASATSILVNADALTNTAGATALRAGAGRFLVYSGDPAQDRRGGLAGAVIEGATLASRPPATVPPGDHFLYRVLSASPPVVPPPPAEPPPVVTSPPPALPPSVIDPTIATSSEHVLDAPAALLTTATPGVDASEDEADVLYSNDGNRELWNATPPPAPKP